MLIQPGEAGAGGHRIAGRGAQPPVVSGQRCQAIGDPLAGVGHSAAGPYAPAAGDGRGQQRRAGGYGFRVQGDHIAGHFAGGVIVPENLFAPRQGRLARAQFHHRPAAVVHHLVHQVAPRGIGGHAHAGAHAEQVNGGAGGDQPRQFVFVQPAAGHDADIVQAGVVQNPAHLPA